MMYNITLKRPHYIKINFIDLKTEPPEIVKQLLFKLTEWKEKLMPPLWPGVMEYEEETDGIKMRFALQIHYEIHFFCSRKIFIACTH